LSPGIESARLIAGPAHAIVCDSKEGMAEQHSANGHHRFLGYGACALAGTLWGTGFYWGRLVLNEMHVEHMVLYRFLFACLGMAPIMLRRRVRLTAGETRIMLLAAFFGIPVQFLLQFHGLALTTVSHASLMVGAMPVMLAAAAAHSARLSADLADHLAHDLGIVDRRLAGDFAGDDGDARGDHRLAGHAAIGVFGKQGVEDAVRNLVGQLIGVSHADRFAGKQKLALRHGKPS